MSLRQMRMESTDSEARRFKSMKGAVNNDQQCMLFKRKKSDN